MTRGIPAMLLIGRLSTVATRSWGHRRRAFVIHVVWLVTRVGARRRRRRWWVRRQHEMRYRRHAIRRMARRVRPAPVFGRARRIMLTWIRGGRMQSAGRRRRRRRKLTRVCLMRMRKRYYLLRCAGRPRGEGWTFAVGRCCIHALVCYIYGTSDLLSQ